MNLQTGIGQSRQPQSIIAGREAAGRALAELSRRTTRGADQLLVFASSGYEPGPLLAGIRGVFPQVPLVGCTGEGVITRDGSDESFHTVVVAAIASPDVHFRSCVSRGLTENPDACVDEVADMVATEAGHSGPSLVLLLPDGLSPSVPHLLAQLDARLPDDCIVAGGTAGDQLAFQKTWQFRDDAVYTDAVVALRVTGDDLVVDIEVSHGCTPMGRVRTVTGSDGHHVTGIDGQPAWDVLQDYLDDTGGRRLDAHGATHLSVAKLIPGTREHVIRSPFALDETTGGVFFPGGIERGARIQLTRREPEAIKAAARSSAAAIAQRHPGQRPSLVLQFDCAGRGRIIFGDRTNEIIFDPVRAVLGADVPWVGFHTFGEIAPVAGQTQFHNYTVVLCAFFERAARDAAPLSRTPP